MEHEEPPALPREILVPFAPRHRRGPLLAATLFVTAVALLFVLGRWSESTQASPSAPAPVRTVLPKATRILAPPPEPPAPAASEYAPMDL